MIEIKDVEKLSELSRIKLTDQEKQQFSKEIDSILAYVQQIQEVTEATNADRKVGEIHNVLREDSVRNETGSNTQVILDEAPAREGDFLKVKKIL